MTTLRQGRVETKLPGSAESDVADGIAEKEMPPGQVIEDIGMGPAQVFTFLLSAGGIWMCDGMEITVITVVTLAAAHDLGVSGMYRGLLSTSAFAGLVVGIAVSGRIGDTLGRKVPIVYSFAAVALLGLTTAVLPSFWGIILFRALLGFGMGFGMPPALAMVSETTPAEWRIPMRSATNIFFQAAGIATCVIAGLEDPTLKEVNWRRLMAIITLPTACCGLLAHLFLLESPVFLASIGRHAEAERVFHWMSVVNGRPCKYNIAGFSEKKQLQGVLTFWEQMSIIFGKRYRYVTIAAMYGCFFINVVHYGHTYAIVQVTGKTTSMPAAWLSILTSCFAIVASLIGGVVFQQLPRKEAACSSLVLALMSVCCFSYAGSIPTPRSRFNELMFRLGVIGIPTAAQLGYIVYFQIAVEIYPPNASATGGSFVIGVGRIGTVMSPMLFEAAQRFTRDWATFYYLLAVLSAIGVLLLAAAPSIKAFSEIEDAPANDADDVAEGQAAKTLMMQPGYGSLAAGKKSSMV
mmetsp:Transcript_102390/g.186970  ORF Transcript_102390/g.186970 Transcript_102390/m.186970 type:complete len:520 (+) Transcript_102390:120-1679(+)